MGMLARNRGDYDRALVYHQEAYSQARQTDDESYALTILWELGTSYLFKQDYERARQCYRESITSGNEGVLAYDLEGSAGLAAAQQQPKRAARLLGAAEALRETADTPLMKLDYYYERFVIMTRAQLDEQDFAAAWAAGRTMTLDEAVAYALEARSAPIEMPPAERADDAETGQPLIDPLNERELEILHLLVDGLNSREAAEKLYLSVETIRWYMKNIYSKLGAHNRTQAIARARELQLIS
jgi:DNA-binding CsgD family transcriptional regulator